MEAYILMSEIYSNMSDSFYSQYIETGERLKEMGQGRKSWDMLSHTKEENDIYKGLYAALPRCAISATIFQALAVEAYVNFYGLEKLGENAFIGKLDWKPIIEKISAILKEKVNKNYPKDSDVCIDLKKLFENRHKLVHCKSKPITIESTEIHLVKSQMNEFTKSMNEQLWFVYEDIEKLMTVYTRLKEQIAQLDGTNLDLAKLQQQKQHDFINEQIATIIGKCIFGGFENNETSI